MQHADLQCRIRLAWVAFEYILRNRDRKLTMDINKNTNLKPMLYLHMELRLTNRTIYKLQIAQLNMERVVLNVILIDKKTIE